MTRANTNIHVVGKDSNSRGTIFARLCQEFFIALGYANFRSDIHKSGREIDLEATHRYEDKHLIAECKATKEPIGGADVNKFVGSLDAERRQGPERAFVGYYVSLSGFTETAIEQEIRCRTPRVILVSPDDLVQTLTDAGVVVHCSQAIGTARAILPGDVDSSGVSAGAELLATEFGWLWLVKLYQNHSRWAYTLVHADGRCIDRNLSNSIISGTTIQQFELEDCILITRDLVKSILPERIVEARQQYFAYLASECGHIQLEGLPADQELRARRLRLENIFLPLHLVEKHDESDTSDIILNARRVPVGEVIASEKRVAILAGPGSGKSTLLKRLATAYSSNERLELVDDQLPREDWLPLYIRCRQLDSLAKQPIIEIIRGLGVRLEREDLLEAFYSIVSDALRKGKVLLLIDGLDEITDESDRLAFSQQLRTFLALYPSIRAVITSRPVGFRAIGSTLAEECSEFSIASLNRQDITELTVSWHREVFGASASVLFEAKELARVISNTRRVRSLARNPLLLTTLLLVKSWIGQLPTRRCALYGKAIEVLLLTWNREGYAPIELDEAIPRLAYVAFEMIRSGKQAINEKQLITLLESARNLFPEILAYSKMTSNEFIRQVEYRSSLLIQKGYEIDSGSLVPIYEFQHLTFQEYLSARAIIDGLYYESHTKPSYSEILTELALSGLGSEVVPLAAVLAGRFGYQIIEKLVLLCESSVAGKQQLLGILLDCITDEVQISPALLERALELIARHYDEASYVDDLLQSKYGEIFTNLVRHTLISSQDDLMNLANVTAAVTWGKDLHGFYHRLEELVSLHEGLDLPTSDIEACEYNLLLMEIAYNIATSNIDGSFEKSEIKAAKGILIDNLKILLDCVRSPMPSKSFTAAWALAWIMPCKIITKSKAPPYAIAIVEGLLQAKATDHINVLCWAFSTLPIVSSSKVSLDEIQVKQIIDIADKALLNPFLEDNMSRSVATSAFIIQHYFNDDFKIEEHVERLATLIRKADKTSTTDKIRIANLNKLAKNYEFQIPTQDL